MSRTPCADREPELEALLFDELEPAQRGALEEHLELCDGCREALEDARMALTALASVSEPSLPYEEDPSSRAWGEFQKRLPASTAPAVSRPNRSYQLAAVAATLVIGIGLGRLAALSPTSERGEAEVETAAIAPEALEALERAELLADIGVRYVDGLQALLVDVARLSVDTVSTEELLLTRARARELMDDGRLLELALDRRNDRALLHAVRRAELLLEELAAVEGSGGGTGVGVFQASLRESRLPDELGALDLERDVSLAIEASGWIGRDGGVLRKDF